MKKNLIGAIIGIGHWGKNYIRIFNEIKNVEIKYLCDQDLNKLQAYSGQYKCINDFKKILKDKEIDFVVISTIASTHANLLKAFMEKNVNVLVEKPVALSKKEISYLNKIKSKSIIFSGFTFLFNPAIIKIKSLIEKNEIGEIYNINFTRTHLGLIREDVSAVWDLAPHDISILLYLFNKELPKDIKILESNPLNTNKSDFAYITLSFKKFKSLIHVSWVDCAKERKIVIVGSRGKIIFDDLNNFEKIKVFKKGISNMKSENNYGEFLLNLRNGGIYSPSLSNKEPLRAMCLSFIKSINLQKIPFTDLEFGLMVSKVLLNAKKS